MKTSRETRDEFSETCRQAVAVEFFMELGHVLPGAVTSEEQPAHKFMAVFWPENVEPSYETFCEVRNALGLPSWERLSGNAWNPWNGSVSVYPRRIVSMASRLMARWMTYPGAPTEHAPTTEQAPSGALVIRFPLVLQFAAKPEAQDPNKLQGSPLPVSQ